MKKAEKISVVYDAQKPTKSLITSIKAADEADLQLLLLLTMHKDAEELDMEELRVALELTEEELAASVKYWRGAGILKKTKKTETKTSGTKDKKQEIKTAHADGKLERADIAPSYTSAELADILEQRADTATLINECQNILGKVFNVHEINVLIGLVDYLGLDCEYIMILLTYCMSIGKRTLHYAEKTAFALYDAGICTAEELSEELRRREVAAGAEGRIRTLFGIGERAFTTKEKKLISSWVGEMEYPIEIIEKAYEVTADATGNASIPYANSVLERWHKEGLRTLDEIEGSYKKGAESKKLGESSFDMDDFFEAAVKRALGDN